MRLWGWESRAHVELEGEKEDGKARVRRCCRREDEGAGGLRCMSVLEPQSWAMT